MLDNRKLENKLENALENALVNLLENEKMYIIYRKEKKMRNKEMAFFCLRKNQSMISK